MFGRQSLRVDSHPSVRYTPSDDDASSAGVQSPTQEQPDDRPNVRYGWNEDYNIWEVFSEEGEWLGLSAAPRPPPSQEMSFEKLAEGILDLSQFDDEQQEVDLDGLVLDNPVAAAEISVSPKGIIPTDDEATPKVKNESFTRKPFKAPMFGFDLMAAFPKNTKRDASVRRAYGKIRSAVFATKSENDITPTASAPYVDSSPPECDNDREATKSLEHSSRDLVRPDADSVRDTGVQKRKIDAPEESEDANDSEHQRKRRRKTSNATVFEAESVRGPLDTNGHPFILLDPTSVERLNGEGARPGRHRMQTSFHIDPDTHPALIEISRAEKEKMWQTSSGTSAGAEDTPTSPNSTARRRSLPKMEVTLDDLRTYSVTVCRSLADTIHQQRVYNLRRGMYTSMIEGYGRWRHAGGLEAWRNARREMTPDERALEAQREWLVRQHEELVTFEPPPTSDRPTGADDPLTSIERNGDGGNENDNQSAEVEQVLHSLDESSAGYAGWGRQWFNISNVGR